jgi:hypothetical protein
MMAQVKAPRNVFINFPLGHQCGKPDDPQLQTQPGDFLDLPYEWHEPFDWACYLRDVEEMIKTEGQPIQDWTPKD